MNQLDILLKILTQANAVTATASIALPLITALISHIKKGADAGQSEDEIVESGLALANETKAITEADMQPTP